jgi:hypothetical protein
MNFSWKVLNIEWIEELNSNSKVIRNVHFWVECVDEEGYKGYTWGNVQLEVDNIEEFIPFDALTEEDVIGWTKQTLLDIEPRDNTTGMTLVDKLQHEAYLMCLEKDPIRTRGIGVPW